MKNLNNYIVEKLRINKNSKLNHSKYLMFTLVERYREEKYIVPDIVEVLGIDENNVLTFEYLTNYHNQQGNKESIMYKIQDPDKTGCKYFSEFIESRKMAFIEEDRAKEILEDCKKNKNYTLCWKKLLDKNYNITGRNIFHNVFAYTGSVGGLRKNSFAKPATMEKLNDNIINDIIKNL